VSAAGEAERRAERGLARGQAAGEAPEVELCPACGKPLGVFASEVWPEGMPASPLLTAVFGKLGPVLPCACECRDRALVKRAAGFMLRRPEWPYVAAHACPDAERAGELAATWARLSGPGFVAWADGPRAEARFSSKATYDAISSGLVRASRSPRVGKDSPRERWALVMDIESMH